MVNRKVGPILYLDLPSIGKYTRQKKVESEQKHCFLGELLFEDIVGYDSVGVSIQLCKHAWSKPS